MNKYENLTEPPKGQFNNSIFLLTIFGPIVSVLAYIGLLWLSNTVLSPDDAKPVKDALGVILGLTGAATAAGGPVGLIVRSLMVTQGKIKAQLPAMPDTLNAAGDVNVNSNASGGQGDFIDNDGDGIQDDEAIEEETLTSSGSTALPKVSL